MDYEGKGTEKMDRNTTSIAEDKKTSRRIPRLIHQMWLSKTENQKPPVHFGTFTKSFIQQNPSYEYRWWDMEKVTQLFLTSERLKPFLTLFMVIEPWICKCDVARYAVLYEYGGIYSDLDYFCLRPLDDLIGNSEVVLCHHMDVHFRKRINNGFLAFAPGHPFMFSLLKEIQKKASWFSPWHFITTASTVLWKTGPSIFYHHLMQYYQNQIPKHFLVDSCQIVPFKTTIWNFLWVYLFKGKPQPVQRYSQCKNVDSFVYCDQQIGSGWAFEKPRLYLKREGKTCTYC